MKSKAQSISINTIIVALLAILVLVVVIAMLTGNLKIFNRTTESCSSVGGVCDHSTDKKCDDGYIPHPSAKKCDDEKLCCIQLSGSEK